MKSLRYHPLFADDVLEAGRTVGVLTLGASEIRKLDGSEILHARRVSA